MKTPKIEKEEKNICESCRPIKYINCRDLLCPCHQPKEEIQFGQPNWGSHSIEVSIPSVESMQKEYEDDLAKKHKDYQDEVTEKMKQGWTKEWIEEHKDELAPEKITKNNWEENYPIPDKEEWWSKSFNALFDKQFRCDVPKMKQFISKLLSQSKLQHNQDCGRKELIKEIATIKRYVASIGKADEMGVNWEVKDEYVIKDEDLQAIITNQ